MEWYYAWQGCAVPPHCDARRKLATHLFYFNTPEDWDSGWGGEVLILDDERRWKAHSGPTFDDLRVAASIDPRGNGSLLFQRTPHSWHGVRPLQPPPDHSAEVVRGDDQHPHLPGRLAAGSRQGPRRLSPELT